MHLAACAGATQIFQVIECFSRLCSIIVSQCLQSASWCVLISGLNQTGCDWACMFHPLYISPGLSSCPSSSSRMYDTGWSLYTKLWVPEPSDVWPSVSVREEQKNPYPHHFWRQLECYHCKWLTRSDMSLALQFWFCDSEPMLFIFQRIWGKQYKLSNMTKHQFFCYEVCVIGGKLSIKLFLYDCWNFDQV